MKSGAGFCVCVCVEESLYSHHHYHHSWLGILCVCSVEEGHKRKQEQKEKSPKQAIVQTTSTHFPILMPLFFIPPQLNGDVNAYLIMLPPSLRKQLILLSIHLSR